MSNISTVLYVPTDPEAKIALLEEGSNGSRPPTGHAHVCSAHGPYFSPWCSGCDAGHPRTTLSLAQPFIDATMNKGNALVLARAGVVDPDGVCRLAYWCGMRDTPVRDTCAILLIRVHTLEGLLPSIKKLREYGYFADPNAWVFLDSRDRRLQEKPKDYADRRKWQDEARARGEVPECGREACTAAASPAWVNKHTPLLYCESCARGINEYNPGLCLPEKTT